MGTTVEELRERQAQWARFEQWQAHEDPARHLEPAEALRWAGILLDWHVGQFGRAVSPAQREDYAGIRLMRERLALLAQVR